MDLAHELMKMDPDFFLLLGRLRRSNPLKRICPDQLHPKDKLLGVTRDEKVSWSTHYYECLYRQPTDLRIAANGQWPSPAQDPADSRALYTLDGKSQRLSSYILSAR